MADQSLISYSSMTNATVDKKKANRLIWGDNLLAMQALLSAGYEGRIKTVYIDPPFWTGEDYYADLSLGGQEIRKSPSVIERLAYKDYWGSGVDSYLDMLFPRLQLMKRLLREDGSIFIHCDYHVGHYLKVIGDEVYGRDNFRNEIIVKRTQKNFIERDYLKSLNVVLDAILVYARSGKTKFHPPYKESKREATWHGFDAPNWAGTRPNLDYELFGHRAPPGNVWRWTKKRSEQAIKDGILRPNPTTGKPEYLVAARDKELCTNLWDDFNSYSFATGFQTEKNLKLLTRILEMGTDSGDIVADFFCGSGTTLLAAESRNAQWIGCDFSKTAIQITRNRLVSASVRPFLLENIGNYQRHLIYLQQARIYEMQTIVLKLYGANPRKDTPDLGTRRTENGKMELVYVSYPDRAVTSNKAAELAQIAEDLDGTGYETLVILGWDYEYNYDEILEERKKNTKKRWRTQIVSKNIPPEVYEYLRKAISESDLDSLKGKIHFHDKPLLKLQKPKIEKQQQGYLVSVGIDKYVLFDYPIEDPKQRTELMILVQNKPLAIIDYWAVDWNYDGNTFRSSWQAMRRNGNKTDIVPRVTSQFFEEKGPRQLAVRVVDVFGNDAGSTLNLRIE